MATILTKRSNTASSVPLAADLTNSTSGAELAVNTADKRLFSKDSGGTVVELGTNPSSLALPSGSANGVAYLNGSKVLTTGSALTFDGTTFNVSSIYTRITQTAAGSDAILDMYGQSSSTGAQIRSFGSDGSAQYLIFKNGNTEAMRLTSTGLGIGTSSPLAKLTVVGTSYFAGGASSTEQARFGYTDGTSYWGIGRDNVTTGNFIINNAGSTVATFSTSGNLGLGVTPSAWGSVKALQINTGGAISAFSNELDISLNSYYNGGYKYVGTGRASLYLQYDGQHQWLNAASGTAGNAISFTQAATLTAAGDFLVGTTSIPNGTSAYGSGFFAASNSRKVLAIATSSTVGQDLVQFFNPNGQVGSISTNGSVTTYAISSDYRLKNITGKVSNSGDYIDSLNPVEGTWKDDGSTFVGLIAHEAQMVSRTRVATGEKDGEQMQGMDYGNSEFIANIIAELQSLRKRVAELEAQ